MIKNEKAEEYKCTYCDSTDEVQHQSWCEANKEYNCTYCDAIIDIDNNDDKYMQHCNDCHPHECEFCGTIDLDPDHSYYWTDECEECEEKIPSEKNCSSKFYTIICTKCEK